MSQFLPLRAGSLLVLLLLLVGGPVLAADPEPAARPLRGSGQNVLERIQEPLNGLRARVINWFRVEAQAVEDEKTRFSGVLRRDLSQLAALVEEAGFEISHVGVGGGLIPEVSMCLAFRRDITDAEEAALRKRVEQLSGTLGLIERRLTLGLLDIDDSLLAAREDGFRFGGVEIDVDLIPSLTLFFVPEGESGC